MILLLDILSCLRSGIIVKIRFCLVMFCLERKRRLIGGVKVVVTNGIPQ